MTWSPPRAVILQLTPWELALLDDDFRDLPAEVHYRLAHAIAHLRILNPTPSTGSMIEIATFPSRHPKTYHYQVIPHVHVWAAQAAIRANLSGKTVFVGVNPRHTMRGNKEDVIATTWIMLDLDAYKVDVWGEIRKLAHFGIFPTLLTVSGNGVHFYIRLTVPVVPAVDAEDTWKRLTILTGTDAVWICNRLARLSGSANLKQPPTFAYIAGYWPERSHTLQHLTAAADAAQVTRNHPRTKRPPHDGAIPAKAADDILSAAPAEIEAILAALDPEVADIIRTGQRPANYIRPGNSELDFRVICTLIRAGIDDETVTRIYTETPIRNLKAHRAGPEYVRATLANARAHVHAGRSQVAPLRVTAPSPVLGLVQGPAVQLPFQPLPPHRSAHTPRSRTMRTILAPLPDWDESISLPTMPKN